jgi:hypothetical protein
MGVLEKEHRDFLIKGRFAAPIATYDMRGKDRETTSAIINWPPDLIAKYQAKFIKGYALSQAWQEVPASIMIGLVEEVRNRVLRFALEIREELGRVNDKPSEVPAAAIEAAVVNHIYGGTNIIAGSARDFVQMGDVTIAPGSLAALIEALERVEISDGEIRDLKKALEEDRGGFGQRTKAWIKKAAGTVAKGGVKVGVAIGQDVLKEFLLQYFDLK